MNLHNMHIWFRQYAQQQGLQNVLAILPSEIDRYINTSIDDNVNELVRSSVGTTNDRILTDSSKLANINGLRTLYKVIEVNAIPNNKLKDDGVGTGTITNPFIYAEDKGICRIKAELTNFRDKNNKVSIPDTGFKPRFLCDFSIMYERDKYLKEYAKDSFVTNLFPVRIIEDSKLADSLNDFIKKPSVRYPAMVIYNESIDIYIGYLHSKVLDKGTEVLGNDNAYTALTESEKYYYLMEHMVPKTLRVSFIAEPTHVKYLEDLGTANIECDLPEHMHVDILKHAVDLYKIATSGALHAEGQRQEQQQQEMTRANARPANEGYVN